MVSSSAVDGLVSGLDTASIIKQLVAVDSLPQAALQKKVTTAESKVSAYQSVNTKLAALQTAAQNLTKATSWTAAKATSSSDGVTATAGADAQPGTVNVFVKSLATARTVVTDPVDPVEDAAKALGFPLDVVSANGTYVGKIDINKGTLNEVAAAINKASSTLGISAVALRISDGVYRLQITSTKTGAESDFRLVPSTGAAQDPDNITEAGSLGLKEMSRAADAEYYITPAGVTSEDQITDQAIPVTSPTNTFGNLMQGVTVTATKTGAATVTVASDPSAVSDSVKALVDAANAALTQIASSTKGGTIGADGSNKGAGALTGDSTLRTLKTQILNSVTSALGGTVSAAEFGIQSTRDGQLSFDAEKFKAAYAADPKKVQEKLAPTSVDPKSTDIGLVERVVDVVKKATGINPVTNIASGSGSLELLIKGQNSTISDLSKRISDWDVRIAAKQAYYQKYYSNLEVALGKLNSQSTWLSGQLSSLNG